MTVRRKPAHHPPRSAQRLLSFFLRRDLAEEVLGDLDEKFEHMVVHKSLFRARINYWYQVINYLRPFAIRKRRPIHITHRDMYFSFFKTAWRNLLRNKLHSVINITGLSAGMTVAILIGLWIRDEVTFNRYHKHYDRIGQVIQNVTNNGEVDTWKTIPYPLADELRKNYGDDFHQVVLTTGSYEHLVAYGDEKLTHNGIYAEPDFPDLLSLTLIEGTMDALKDPSAALISRSMATTFFGEDDPMNKTITIDEETFVRVAGVYEDLPNNSHFAGMDFIIPWEIMSQHGWIKGMEDPWRPNAFSLFVRIAENADFDGVSRKIKDAKLKKINTELAKKNPALFIHPMSQWHLHSDFRGGKNVGGRIQYVWLFGIVGIFVLLMACINFMNLSTARSEKRAREIGIRKAIGSFRGQLIAQFFSESVLTAIFAFVMAVILILLILPAFNQVADKEIGMQWNDLRFWLAGLGFSIFTGLLAGSYPALYLSSIRSVRALKGAYKAGRSAVIPRKVLVIVQFTVSVILIIGTVIVFQQIQHAKNRPIGYDRSGLVAVYQLSDEIHKHFDAVKNTLEKDGAIEGMAEASSPPTQIWATSSGFKWSGQDTDLSVDFPFYNVSYDYGKTIGWKVIGGRDFSREFPSDTAAMILNEAASDYMNLKEPVGEVIRWFGTPYTVIGVVDNIISGSPYDQIRPTVYALTNDAANYAMLKLSPESSTAESLRRIEEVFEKFNPAQPFAYQFVDDEYARKFGDEERVGKLAGFFAALAILISCLGIFGLASFVAEQRTREIGVRKIHGASVFNLWAMVSKDFVVLVFASSVLAVPIAYYFLLDWLQQYEYRVSLQVWIFVAAVAGTLAITILTVSFHTLNVARMNPVKSLRSE